MYEGDSGEGDVVKISIYPLDYSQYTPAQQMGKVLEELKELEVAGDKLDRVTEEVFDVIQALVGYLITLGVDIEAANRRHMEKLERRHGRVQETKKQIRCAQYCPELDVIEFMGVWRKVKGGQRLWDALNPVPAPKKGSRSQSA